jgi:site-specific recombinase XerD
VPPANSKPLALAPPSKSALPSPSVQLLFVSRARIHTRAHNFKIADIDAARMTLRVKQGKGSKDRYAILSQNLLVELRQYWERYRPSIWLFPNRAKNAPLSRGEASW